MFTRVQKLSNLNTAKSFFKFATNTINDPYYILGVQKTAEMSEIKKAFYKLANEYHPDKVDGDNNADKFLLIKQAYQSIKMQKGLIKPAGFIYDSDVKSMRPDPSRFDTDDQQYRRSGTDYKMHRERAQAAGQEYEQFKGTFKTLDDINDIKIRVEKGTMKDSSSRFNLADMKTRLIKFSSNSSYYYFFILAGAISFGIYYQKFSNENKKLSIEESISKQDHKLSKRRIFDEEELKQKKYMAQIEADKDIKEYLEKNKSASRNYSGRKKEIQRGDGSV